MLALSGGIASTAAAQGSNNPYYAIKAPVDAQQVLSLGSVSVSTFSPVTITPTENSTNLYFVVKNQGSQPLTLDFLSWDEILATKPDWLFHFFKFFGYVGGPTSTVLAAGETTTLEFYVSKDVKGGQPQQATLPFTFQIKETGQQGTLNVTFIGDDLIMQLRATQTSAIAGRVTGSDGLPVAKALVSVSAFNENLEQHVRTDADGKFQFGVLSIADMKTIMGPRPFPYASMDYFITVEADGYALAYQGGLAPVTGQTLTQNVTLQNQAGQASYKLVGELATNGKLAYWWIRFAGKSDRVVSVQGQHPPVDPRTPGHMIAVDLTGKELWRIETGQQCWGLDVSTDGKLIAAGCYDGYAYVADLNGSLLYKVNIGSPSVTDVRFSPDGRYLLGDGIGGTGVKGFTVMNAATGAVVWDSALLTQEQVPQGAYKARWTADSKRLVAGSGGPVAMFSDSGSLIWRNNIGESPLWLEVDAAYNSYAAGKNRELFSWDKEGKLRWRHRLAHTSNEAWPGISADASIMVIPSFNGLLQALNSSGQLLWQRFLPALPNISPQGTPEEFIFGAGHNALSMTPDGNLMAVGSRGYQTLLYDRKGTLVFRHSAAERSDSQGPDPVIIRNYPGVTGISLSPDGKYIAAGYADSVIRIFAREDAISVSAGWNLVGNGTDAAITVATSFADPGQFVTVWKWFSTQNAWAFYAPGLAAQGGTALTDYATSKGYRVLETIAGGEGFWVNAKQATSVVLPSGSAFTIASLAPTLVQGWNLTAIGETATPKQFCDAQSTGVTTLWAWDAKNSAWYFYAPSLDAGSDLANYITSKGYLDFTTAGKTLGPGTGFWVNKR